ncbi:MAG: ribbon-helix-helix domain-containing protein [Candidatus Woesearchaeota archaeon]|nr:ribbon-helix-helix domain-containing protein [Candidatus Woesearchaeota archaeon]
MPKEKKNKERYNFLIDKATYEDFSLLCEELGLIRSKIVENALKEFIEKNKELLKKLK